MCHSLALSTTFQIFVVTYCLCGSIFHSILPLFIAVVQADITDPCRQAVNIGDRRRSTAYVPLPYESLLMDSDLQSSNVI